MPDANYYRIYNELGIIGGIIFFMPFLAIFLKALSRKDPFMLFLITYTLFAFYFNRVLWAVPTAYVIYTIIGISESKEYGRPNI
jgi:Ca2+/Na+ antiporter